MGAETHTAAIEQPLQDAEIKSRADAIIASTTCPVTNGVMPSGMTMISIAAEMTAEIIGAINFFML